MTDLNTYILNTTGLDVSMDGDQWAKETQMDTRKGLRCRRVIEAAMAFYDLCTTEDAEPVLYLAVARCHTIAAA